MGYYERLKEEWDLSNITLLLRQVYISTVSLGISLPIGMLVVKVFNVATTEPRLKDDAIKKGKWIRKRILLTMTWFLCLSIILTSAFLIVWYGISFGNKKSLMWLSTIGISFVKDLIIVQPLKVIVFTLVTVAYKICRKNRVKPAKDDGITLSGIKLESTDA